MKKNRFRYWLHKVIHWEYWPQWLVYAPVTPVYIYYTIKARTPFFVTAANPSMENGGYLAESKFTIHNQLAQQPVAQTILIAQVENYEQVKEQLHTSGISYPFFCKPDIGGKGRGVEKVENENGLRNYHKKSPVNYLIQAAIPFKNEIGVFYCRLPGEAKGFISGIVGKSTMEIKGDGAHTVKELIEAVPRYYYQRHFLFEKYKAQLHTIPAAGNRFLLSEIGNHARGSLFTDLTHYNNAKLETVIDSISKAYNTFYFGRYDIKFNSWEELYEGKNFMIVELNGSGSEPTHIYDPRKTIWQAWKIILQHWKLLYNIAAANHKNGVPYLSFKEGRKLQQIEKEINKKFKQQAKKTSADNRAAIPKGADQLLSVAG
ncbi:hypothetical protein [Ferruginibacter sp.]